jgi:hypothetical protein
MQDRLRQAQGTVRDGQRLSRALLRREKRHSQTQQIFLGTSEVATLGSPLSYAGASTIFATSRRGPPADLTQREGDAAFGRLTISSDKQIS